MPQAPALQVATPLAGAGHALPQAPQFATFARTSMQAPAHASVGNGQVLMHFPAAQASLAWHVTPQPPQLAGSVCT
jgi:hypothetical protein